MAKTPKTPTPEAEIKLVRSHPSNPILVTQEDAPTEGFSRIQIRTPRYLVVRGGASNRLDLGATIHLPAGVTAQIVALQPDAHARGYSVDGGILSDGDEVSVFLRNHTIRTVEFHEGDVVALMVFQRRSSYTIEIDCALPPVPVKMVQSRAGKVLEDELPFEN